MPVPAPQTLTSRLRQQLAIPLERLGQGLAGLGIHPDWLTIAGLALVGVAALQLAQGAFLAGGILLAFSLPFDALDGATARARGSSAAFGMVLDSTLDRYADGFIFAAFGYYFAQQSRLDMLLLALAALLGSFIVSYVRARAEDARVAVAATVGWFTRLERLSLVLLMTLAAGISGTVLPLELGLLLLAIGTNMTALQRMRFVEKTLRKRGD